MRNTIGSLENLTSITVEELKNIQSKLEELDSIVHGKDKPLVKWDKIKDITKWILDKSLDVGIACLPFVMESMKNL